MEIVQRKILFVRGMKVMMDFDLAALYGVETKVLNQAVKRNAVRFPKDFMFQLSVGEYAALRSQFVTFTAFNRKHLAFCFAEQGIAMLSSVLNSEQAIQVNIAIMRAFVKLREMIASHVEMSKRVQELEKKYDAQFKVVFDAIRALMAPPPAPTKLPIGFHVREGCASYCARRVGKAGTRRKRTNP